jgi:hypothetical protein
MPPELYKAILYIPPVAQWPAQATEKRLIGILRVMSEAHRGERNDTLYWCGRRIAEAQYAKTDWQALAQTAESTGLPRTEIRTTIRSAQKTAGADQ